MNNFSNKTSNVIKGGFIYLIMIVAFLVISLIGQSLLLAVGLQEGALFYALNSIFSILAIILAVFFTTKTDGVKALTICNVKKFDWVYILFAILLSAGMFLGLGFLNYTISKAFVLLGLRIPSNNLAMNSTADFIIFSICLCLLPAIFEECFFRGVLLNGVKGKGYAVVLTVSFCFAIYHGSFVQFFYQFIYGAGLTLLAIKSKSIFPSVVSHFINNFLVVLFAFIGLEVNFLNPLVITIGLLILVAFTLLVIFYRNKQNDLVIIQNNGSSVKEFFIPFGILGTGLMSLLAILSLIP